MKGRIRSSEGWDSSTTETFTWFSGVTSTTPYFSFGPLTSKLGGLLVYRHEHPGRILVMYVEQQSDQLVLHVGGDYQVVGARPFPGTLSPGPS